jgi:hypothetical protein
MSTKKNMRKENFEENHQNNKDTKKKARLPRPSKKRWVSAMTAPAKKETQ